MAWGKPSISSAYSRMFHNFLRLADVMIFPSLWEGLPGAVLESLAVGTPVVASDIPRPIGRLPLAFPE
jgi:glycosyltransferase involved in cell wall biosynthesis